MCNCIHELLNVFVDSAQHIHTIALLEMIIHMHAHVPYMSIKICIENNEINYTALVLNLMYCNVIHVYDHDVW